MNLCNNISCLYCKADRYVFIIWKHKHSERKQQQPPQKYVYIFIQGKQCNCKNNQNKNCLLQTCNYPNRCWYCKLQVVVLLIITSKPWMIPFKHLYYHIFKLLWGVNVSTIWGLNYHPCHYKAWLKYGCIILVYL